MRMEFSIVFYLSLIDRRYKYFTKIENKIFYYNFFKKDTQVGHIIQDLVW